MNFHSSTAQVVKPSTSIAFITAFQLLEIHWRTFKLVERWLLRFLYQSLVHQSNSSCCYYMNTCLRGHKCNYTAINQSDSFCRNSADFKFVCMQVYQTLLLLRERGSGSETRQLSVHIYSSNSTEILPRVAPEKEQEAASKK